MKTEQYSSGPEKDLHVKRVEFDQLHITQYQHGNDNSRHYLGSIHGVTEITRRTRKAANYGKVTTLKIRHRNGSTTELSLFHE